MKETTIIDLVQNTAILLVLAMLYEFFWLKNEASKSIWPKIISGLALSGIGIVLMLTPWTFIPGVIFDARSIMLSISGLFLGPIPTIIAMLLTGFFRVMLGGDGMWMGIAVIISSGTIGLLWRQFRTSWRGKNIYIELLVMGVIVHLVMLGCVGLLPSDKILLTLKTLALPLMLIYSPGTMLLGILLLRETNTYQNKLSLLQEIADRKRAEEAIFQSKKDWEETFDSLTDMITVHDKDYNIIHANKAGKALLNLPEIEKQMKLKCFSFYHGTSAPPAGCPSCDCFKKGLPGVFESFEPHLNRFLEIRAIPRFDSDYHLVGMIHVVRDITERKQVEEALTKEQYLMNSLMDNLPLHIYFKDKESRFIRINDAHAQSFGLSVPGEEIGKTDFDFFTEEHARQAYEDEQAIIQSGKPLFKEEKNTWKDRPDTWVSTIKLPLVDHEGNIVGTFGISRDITEKKHVEEELIKALEKAEESDRLKTAFLNNISHEIRTPFNGILGFLSLIQDDDLPGNERDEYIGLINQSADRLMHTINDIVEISQIQAGQMQVTTSETNIKRLTDKLSDRFKTVAESQRLEFTIINDLPNNMECISTDGIKLKTILSNLISNAIKFTKTGSIVLGIRENDNYLEFSVKDTGIGISENQQQVIFERFNQADVSKTRQFEGLGLGLSIAKFYIEMLGGKIWLESELDKGSTFHFTLPYVGC